ncbi:MAG: hypothetical protein IK109_05910, partial [Clostridiales bacterium]|nr:hypothetical protein [Clostridiales bacterium]
SAVTEMIRIAIRPAMASNANTFREGTYTLHDLCPVLYQDHPELFRGTKAGVYVETRSALTMGKTISDRFTLMDQRLPAKNTLVMEEVEREKMVDIVKGMLLSYE